MRKEDLNQISERAKKFAQTILYCIEKIQKTKIKQSINKKSSENCVSKLFMKFTMTLQ